MEISVFLRVHPLLIMRGLRFAPEVAGEQHEDGHDFETSHEHEQTENPLDVHGQDCPRHDGAYLCAERGSDVAHAAQGDGNRVGVVDARHDHHGGGEEHHEHGEGEEGEECDELRLRDVLAVDSDGQHGVGMQYLSETVAHHLQQHDATHAFQSAAGAAGAGTEIHHHAEDDPGDVGPLAGILVEHAGGGHERDYLEQCAAEGVLDVVAHAGEEQVHNPCGGYEEHADVEFELRVLQQRLEAEFEDADVEQREVDAREKLEEDGDVVD